MAGILVVRLAIEPVAARVVLAGDVFAGGLQPGFLPERGVAEIAPVFRGAVRGTLRASLVIADVLLLALAAAVVTKTPGRLGLVEVLLCTVAIGLGAWLTCLALWRD